MPTKERARSTQRSATTLPLAARSPSASLVRMTTSAPSPPRRRSNSASVGAKSASMCTPACASNRSARLLIAPFKASVESTRTAFSIALSPAHQLQHRGQSQAALACQCGGFQQRALLVASAGKADADLVAAEERILVLGRRVLLIEDLAPPAAVRRNVGADIVEERIAAENAAFIEQHHAGQAAGDAVKHPDVDGIESV